MGRPRKIRPRGRPPVTDELKQLIPVTVRLTGRALRRMDNYCEKHPHLSRSEITRRALEGYMRKK